MLYRGFFPFPITLEKVKFSSAFQAFRFFDTTIDLKASKESKRNLHFDLDLQNPFLKVAAKGELQSQPNKRIDFRARLANLKIFNAPSEEAEGNAAGPSEKPVSFNFSMVKSRDFFGAASVKAFRYNDFPALKDVDLTVKCMDDKAVVQGTVQLCHIPLSLQAVVIPPNLIAAQLEGKGANINLASFISCFSKELPLFLKGRLSIGGTLFTEGTNTQALADSLQGDVMVTLNRCTVHRLSNLDYRLAFLMDILGAAGISSLREDSITFRKGIAKANFTKDRMILNNFTLTGPLLSAVGSGEFVIKKKHLKISGQVQTAMGITEEFVVRQNHDKEGDVTVMHLVSNKTKGFLLLCMMVFALTSCIGQKKPKVISHVSEDKIPHKIAVLPAIYMAPENEDMSIGIKSGSEEEKFVCDLVRGVIHNQLAGKGYSAQPLDLVDRKLRSKGDGKAC